MKRRDRRIAPARRGGKDIARVPAEAGRRRNALLVTAALTLGIIAIYAPVAFYTFVSWDDPQYVITNPHVARGLTWAGVSWAFTTGYMAAWHPLTWLSFMADVTLFGPGAGPHHIVNVALHAANAILVFGLLFRMTGALGRSAFVAALFAFHPLRVESVAWVTERKDVLSTFFMMLSIAAYVRFVGRRRFSAYAVLLMAFACAVMSKSMAVTLPFALLLLDVWPLGRVTPGRSDGAAWRPVLLEKVPLIAVAAAASAITVLVAARNVAGFDVLPIRYRFENALVSYVLYVRDMLWPAGLAAFYPYHPYSIWGVLAAVAMLATISGIALVSRTARPYIAVGWCWYVGTLLPVIGLLQAGGQSRADRFTYVPLVGLFIAIAWGVPEFVERWPNRRAVLRAAATGVVASCIVLSSIQVRYWKDSEALWGRALAVTTDNYRAHNHYGVALSDQGRSDEAVAHYQEALRIWPEFAEAHVNLGVALAEKGRLDDAIAQYQRALAIKPALSDARNDLASAFAGQGRTQDAIQQLLEAAKSTPGDPTIEYNLGILYESVGQRSEAARHLNAALAADPASADARDALARVLRQH